MDAGAEDFPWEQAPQLRIVERLDSWGALYVELEAAIKSAHDFEIDCPADEIADTAMPLIKLFMETGQTIAALDEREDTQ